MATREDTIRATVRSLREHPPPGLDTCFSDGGSIRVVEDDERAHRTYPISLPPDNRRLDAAGNVWQPAPGSVAAAVVAEYGRQRIRLELCEARARSAAVTGTAADQGRPVAVSVQPNPDGSVRVTLARPWSREQLDALRRLEKQRAAQIELEQLARGPQPPETVIVVPLDDGGCVCLDSLPPDPADRAAVLAALTEQDPPADGDPPSPPGDAP